MKTGKTKLRGQSSKRPSKVSQSTRRLPVKNHSVLKVSKGADLGESYSVSQETSVAKLQETQSTKAARMTEEQPEQVSPQRCLYATQPLTLSQSIIRQINATLDYSTQQQSVRSPQSNPIVTKSKRIAWQRTSMSQLLPFPEYQYFMSWTYFANQALIEHLPYKQTASIMKMYPGEQTVNFIKGFKDTFVQNYNALQYCKQFRYPPYTFTKPKVVNLPPFDEKRCTTSKQALDRGTIILDMDETLMHCNESPDMPADYILPVRFPTGEQIEIRISVRPHVRETLETLAKSFELVVFTASHESYANKVLDTLDPKKEFLNLRFYRDSCFLAEDGLLIKDLRIFANRDLKKVVLVDNAAYSYSLQIGNGVPILPYYNNKADKELLWLTNYLSTLEGDFTRMNRRMFKLHLYQEGMSVDESLIMMFQDFEESVL